MKVLKSFKTAHDAINWMSQNRIEDTSVEMTSSLKSLGHQGAVPAGNYHVVLKNMPVRALLTDRGLGHVDPASLNYKDPAIRVKLRDWQTDGRSTGKLPSSARWMKDKWGPFSTVALTDDDGNVVVPPRTFPGTESIVGARAAKEHAQHPSESEEVTRRADYGAFDVVVPGDKSDPLDPPKLKPLYRPEDFPEEGFDPGDVRMRGRIEKDGKRVGGTPFVDWDQVLAPGSDPVIKPPKSTPETDKTASIKSIVEEAVYEVLKGIEIQQRKETNTKLASIANQLSDEFRMKALESIVKKAVMDVLKEIDSDSPKGPGDGARFAPPNRKDEKDKKAQQDADDMAADFAYDDRD